MWVLVQPRDVPFWNLSDLQILLSTKSPLAWVQEIHSSSMLSWKYHIGLKVNLHVVLANTEVSQKWVSLEKYQQQQQSPKQSFHIFSLSLKPVFLSNCIMCLTFRNNLALLHASSPFLQTHVPDLFLLPQSIPLISFYTVGKIEVLDRRNVGQWIPQSYPSCPLPLSQWVL